ncbi:prealbumin-like fold domain-containing protein, partial [Chitinimonas sp. PSY-7]|uniref:prealbumin-like fold domain-containing protein n=1 Tax=Chitinimonas sp. PSY-7 TaxID=3459088 RepID=UPI00404037F8
MLEAYNKGGQGMEQQIELKQRLLGLAHDKHEGLKGYSKAIRFGLGRVLRSLPLMVAMLLGPQALAVPQTCALGETAQTFAFTAGSWVDSSLGPTLYPVGGGANATQLSVSVTDFNIAHNPSTDPTPRLGARAADFTLLIFNQFALPNTAIGRYNLSFNRLVNKLSFEITDIDSQNNGVNIFQDTYLFGANNGSALLPTAITPFDPTKISVNLAAGTVSAPDPAVNDTSGGCLVNDNFCDVTVDFSQSGINSATATYIQGPAGSNGTQATGLLNISWCLPPTTIAVTAVSNGGVGPFTYTGDNGYPGETLTTTVPATGITGAIQTLTTSATGTTITEAIPPGYVLTGATCTGLGAGGTATPNLAAGTVTLDAAATAAGSNIACTFTNAKLPTVTVSTVSNGGTGGFPYTGTNGVNNFTNTTVTAGTPVTGPVQTLTAVGT